MTDCYECGKPAGQPHEWILTESMPYKRQGWVGDQFVPYDRKWKGVKETRVTLCGICYATHEVEGMRERGIDVTELELALLDIAKSEAAAQTTAPKANGTATNRKPTRKVHRNGTGVKARRETFTQTSATMFNTVSVPNAMLAESGRGCDCLAYVDIFTYRRWQAQGYQVRKGSKGSKIPILKDVVLEDSDTGEAVSQRQIKGTATVFCRCQVDELAQAVA